MPYSWDDSHDYETKDITGSYSFKDARKSYDDIAVAKTSSKAFYTYKSPFLTTDALYPIIIGIDTTGSMEEWPSIFFEKLPLLYKEAIKYFPECEISFQAINDFYADGHDVALQPAPFGKGPQLDEFIGQLYPYGGGGGNGGESYEIFAAYNSFLKAPKSLIKPIAIILGDEPLFEDMPKEISQYYKFSKEGKVSTKEAFKRLHETCDVFLVRKPYVSLDGDGDIIATWQKYGLMPKERIMTIKDPRRVVDVILGVLGILTGKADLFEDELKSRQEPKQVKEVMGALKTLKATYHGILSQNSVSGDLEDDKTEKTKSLL